VGGAVGGPTAEDNRLVKVCRGGECRDGGFGEILGVEELNLGESPIDEICSSVGSGGDSGGVAKGFPFVRVEHLDMVRLLGRRGSVGGRERLGRTASGFLTKIDLKEFKK
jgi:hypothetical protein